MTLLLLLLLAVLAPRSRAAAHVDAAHVEAAHVEAAHVEAAHVEAAHVEAAHVAATLVDAALARLDAMETAAPEELGEAQALARTALEMAGEDALPHVQRRLRDGGVRCAIAAWALGESAPEWPASADAIGALTRAATGTDWECRLAGVSALGRLGAAPAAPTVLAAWSDPLRPPGTDAVVLLALAGTGGADDVLRDLFERGGDEAWSVLAVAVAARRGPAASAMLAEIACTSADPPARQTATLALLLLADPAAGCALSECAASERDPALRRLKYQALGASGSPTGRALLLHAGALEPDPELRAAAASLALHPLQAPARPGRTPSSRDVREALRRIARGEEGPRAIADVEAGATSVDLAAIERTMRLLPLRSDRGWYDELARLGQLRARLLCAADPDCEPVTPRVGRLP